jgi:hypothetical protein
LRIRKVILSTLIISFTVSSLTACGRKPNPVATCYPTDQILTCKSLLFAMDEAQDNIDRLIPQTQKTGKNIAIGAAGILLFWPALFFLDFSDAEKVEIEAHRDRYNHLVRLYDDKNCAADSSRPQVVAMPKFNGDYKLRPKKEA